ncbi:ABC transporter ATP-binding protein [Bifidobacterium vespertilionis]|uniref:ABC transporter ATP-binding protein n=1 Tax=Bifidobacterium vespertilionis TaxID=2562524 RepID=UPI001BDC3E0F|nr:ABC transporter ATP-binding protein [Bifidobacterium vespertilionis]MBT1180197.1 ABC transporter ATP-binding protein [Bifidobacterium vespertilionis]
MMSKSNKMLDVQAMDTSSNTVLSVRHLKTYFYPDDGSVRKAVDDVSFDVQRGRICCLIGESGSGKSATAMSIINLVDRPGKVTGGNVLFGGRDLLTLDTKQLRTVRGASIGMIFQEPMHSLDPVFTIGEQIVETILAHEDVPRVEAAERAVTWLKRVELPNPEAIMTAYPHELSGGMLQRAMIAIALCCGPKLLIADEPTTALDVTVQAQILRLLVRLKDEIGLSILLITHDLGVVAETADDVLVMYDGHIVERGPVEAVFDRPQHPYTKALLLTRPIIGQKLRRLPTLHEVMREVDDGEIAQPKDWSTLATTVQTDGDKGEAHSTDANGNDHDSTPILTVRHLSKYFERVHGLKGEGNVKKAVDDVSFDVHRGETVGLVGESGSGKTTTGQTVLRLHSKTAGEVLFDGIDVFALNNRKLAKLRTRMQYVFQDPYSALNPRLKIGFAIGEALLHHKLATKRDVMDKVVETLELCGMDSSCVNRYPHEFSGGQRQRIVIARAMALQPEFVVADEPVSALDVSIQAEIINLFSELQHRKNVSFLFISHDLSVVEHICSSILVMHHGRITERGTVDDVFNHPKDDYTKSLLDSIPASNPKYRKIGR